MGEALSHLGLPGLRCPPLLYLRSLSSNTAISFRSNNLSSSTVICRSSKWADRLIGDFHSSATTTVESPSPLSPDPPLISLDPSALLPSADRSLPLPIDFNEIPTSTSSSSTNILSFNLVSVSYQFRCMDSRCLVLRPTFGATAFDEPTKLGFQGLLTTGTANTPSWPGARSSRLLMNPSSTPALAENDRALLEEPDFTITTYVPWDKVLSSLCVLQETGQAELDMRIGKALLLERLPKTFKQDVVLSVVLTYVDLSSQAMALARQTLSAAVKFLRWL